MSLQAMAISIKKVETTFFVGAYACLTPFGVLALLALKTVQDFAKILAEFSLQPLNSSMQLQAMAKRPK